MDINLNFLFKAKETQNPSDRPYYTPVSTPVMLRNGQRITIIRRHVSPL
jgi:hypothetical protein